MKMQRKGFVVGAGYTKKPKNSQSDKRRIRK
jgi:hypothetical protein